MRRNFKQFYERASCKTQEGAALILFVMFIALGITAYTLKVFSPDWLQLLQDTNNSNILADAKAALIGYTLSGASERPGDMPLPDYLSTSESPANYDGTSDGGCMDVTKTDGLPLTSSGTNMRCLGRLPWQTLGMSISSPSQNDNLGYMPWYAVSANLVDPACLSVLNSGTLNMTYTGYVCGGSTLPHPWLTVRDNQGNVLSSRVAVLLILPGKPIGSQSRPSSPLGGVANYLDTVTVPVTCTAPCVPGTYSNSDLDDDFIMSGGLSGSDSSSNDRVLYITIDELLEVVVKRAAGEARSVLKTYNTSNGRFPFAAPLGAPLGTGNYIAVSGSYQGTIPVDVTDTCSCASSTSCTCGFSLVSKVSFKRSGGSTWSASSISGACTRPTTQTCSCTGAGYCKNTSGSRNFTCTSLGACTHNTTGTYTYTPSSYGTISTASSGCSLLSGNAVCTSSGSFTTGLNMPSWFTDNNWQDYFYYRWTTISDLQVGPHGSIQALVIGTGNPIISSPYAVAKGSAQTTPSPSINDYLDSNENTNGDTIFDAINTTRSSSYNDQSFIVAP